MMSRCAQAAIGWVAAGLLVGCSGLPAPEPEPLDPSTSTTSTATQVGARTRRTAPLQTYVVEITDGVFHSKVLSVQAGVRLKLELVNHGPGPLEFENAEMNVEKIVNAGVRSFIVLAPLAPGAYEFVDEFNPVSGVMTIDAR